MSQQIDQFTNGVAWATLQLKEAGLINEEVRNLLIAQAKNNNIEEEYPQPSQNTLNALEEYTLHHLSVII